MTFTLADGTTFTITKTKPFDVTFDVSDIRFSLGNSYTVNYTITGADARTSIQLMTSDGLKAKWEQTALEAGVATGIITVTMPKTIVEQSTVAVLVSDGRGKVLMKAITFVYEGSANLEDDTLIITTGSPLTAGAEGGTLTADVQTNMNYTIEVADDCKGWLTAGLQTKALRDETIEFIVAANTGGQRTGFVYLRDISDNSIIETICITQEGDPAVLAETVTFADPNFKAFILSAYDVNGDGELQKTEALEILSIDIGSKGFSSLAGIEHFPNLISLSCGDGSSSDKINTLDVSQNTKLEILNCAQTNISSIDLSKNIALKKLICDYNKNLTILDISNNSELTYLDCNSTGLTLLNLNNLAKLETVYCNGGSIKTIKTEGCIALTKLNCEGNDIVTLDLSDNTNLKELYCANNELLSLDLSANKELLTLYCGGNLLSRLNLSNNAKLASLSLSSNLFTEIDLGNIPFIYDISYEADNTSSFNLNIKGTNLKNLTVNGNSYMTGLDITGCEKLVSLKVNDSHIKAVDLSNLPLIETIDFNYNNSHLESLDLTNNLKLKSLTIGAPSYSSAYTSTVHLTQLDLSSNTELTTLSLNGISNLNSMDLSNNLLINKLTLTQNTNLSYLNLGDNPYLLYIRTLANETGVKLKIKSKYLEGIYDSYSSNTYNPYSTCEYYGGFDLSECPNLKVLSVYSDGTTSFDLSASTDLNYLFVRGNQLQTLNINKNSALKHLAIAAPYMQSLDLSGNTGLTYLSCTGSSIASIDLSKNTELTEVYLSENKLTTLDVSPLTKLTTLDVSPMETLQTLYVGTAQSINYITYNRNANYIPAATAIVTK